MSAQEPALSVMCKHHVYLIDYEIQPYMVDVPCLIHTIFRFVMQERGGWVLINISGLLQKIPTNPTSPQKNSRVT